ncbi:MAG: polysaccharide biosynthesis protein [Bacteroidales bacterium]|nr:polysaccharide biosynthesis protein [Bacteroidales bacterium]
MIFLKKHTPRWIVFVIDVFISIGSITLAYLLRFNFQIPDEKITSLQFVIPFVISVRIISFIISKTYAGIVRFTGTKDAERIFIVISLGSLFFTISNIVSYYFITGRFIIPSSIVVIDFITTIFMMTALRFLVKTIYMEFNLSRKDITNIIIFGADQSGIKTKNTLERDEKNNYRIVAFIDIQHYNINKKIEGITIHHINSLDSFLNKNKISKLIFAKQLTDSNLKNEIVEICLNHNVNVLTVPDINSWIDGELSFNQIKNINIEDLLEREPIKLDEKRIKNQILNQTILVTGAAGSIGSEIVRQIINFNPKKIVLFDHAESPLYDLELSLREIKGFFNYDVVIGDITNEVRVRNVFNTFKPDLVYHAAAYKHVPMMENNPTESIRANVLGTKIISDLSVEYKVKTFVMVSTDKAVNPTNVMGASKRLAEMYVQSINKQGSTNFITTRFGNVLGSNGSVIPRFKRQIENGGPVTVTHPDVTRYFMTIPEACQLVLEASAMGRGGEIYIFDMGKSIKIVDLAKKMIKLSGLTLGKDIQLNFTGLRPGEKLYEELLNDKENTIPTYHSQIMIAKIHEYDFNTISNQIKDLISLMKSQDNFKVVALMKKIVTEFISKNSVYEELDKK